MLGSQVAGRDVYDSSCGMGQAMIGREQSKVMHDSRCTEVGLVASAAGTGPSSRYHWLKLYNFDVYFRIILRDWLSSFLTVEHGLDLDKYSLISECLDLYES